MIPTAFTLWHRLTRRSRWRAVGEYATQREALGAVNGAGDWIVRATGSDPNTDRRPR